MSGLDDDESGLELNFDDFLQSSACPPTTLSPLPISDDADIRLADHHSIETLSESIYDINDLLEEALVHYDDKKPAFCVGDKREKQKTVRLIGNDEEAQLTFCPWLDGKWGYWMLTDPIGDRYICKYEKGYYHVWEGVSSSFSKQPVARSITNPNKPQSPSTTNNGAWKDDLDDMSSPLRSLRKRTTRQQKPYAMDRLQRRSQMRGIHVTESQLEESLLLGKADKSCVSNLKEEKSPDKTLTNNQQSIQAMNVSKLRLSNQRVKHVLGVHASDSESSHVILRTRIESFTGPSIPLYLESATSASHLFDMLHQRWNFRLGYDTIECCVARFPWLNENDSVLLQANDEDSYRLLCDEAGRHKEQLSERVNVDLELCTKSPA